MPVPLVLASASPARLATLRAAGIEPRVIVSTVNEEALLAKVLTDKGGAPSQAVEALLLAKAKAEDVARTAHPDALVLGCDSVLELDGASHGKPGTADVARERWVAMRGRTGVLHTGHWLIDARSGATDEAREGVGDVSSTVVRFANLSDGEIDAYVATGEPLNVAGGFTVDGLGGPFIEGIDGDHHGVVGLSLPLLRALLGRIGLTIPELWTDPRFVPREQPTMP